MHDDPRFLERLADAVESLRLGPADDLATDMAPLVRPADGSLLRALTELDPGERWLVEPRRLDDRGAAWSPGVRLGVQPGSWFHLTECFGPVLGVLRAPDLATAVAWQNMPPFGLTGGIHSLDPAEVAQWLEAVEVGNAYVNRGITGAIVQRQPFGGWKRSAVGPTTKAGGPDHVASLGRWSLDADATGDGAERDAPRRGGRCVRAATRPGSAPSATSCATARCGVSSCGRPTTSTIANSMRRWSPRRPSAYRSSCPRRAGGVRPARSRSWRTTRRSPRGRRRRPLASTASACSARRRRRCSPPCTRPGAAVDTTAAIAVAATRARPLESGAGDQRDVAPPRACEATPRRIARAVTRGSRLRVSVASLSRSVLRLICEMRPDQTWRGTT